MYNISIHMSLNSIFLRILAIIQVACALQSTSSICSAGFYRQNISCSSCPAGTYSSVPDATECLLVPQGLFLVSYLTINFFPI